MASAKAMFAFEMNVSGNEQAMGEPNGVLE
jgi:hypothetical protein